MACLCDMKRVSIFEIIVSKKDWDKYTGPGYEFELRILGQRLRGGDDKHLSCVGFVQHHLHYRLISC